MNDPYENLSNAIVLQAVKDYRKALRDLKTSPGYAPALRNKSEVESFFRSRWYTMLTRVDGEYLITMLQKEVA